MESLPIRFEQEIDLPATANRKARRTKLAVRFSAVNLRTPYRFDNREPFPVYAVYATEIDGPEGETPLSWMLLTTELVEDVLMASTILRWYTYRWRVEDYHQILKSGCQSERYRLAAVGMKTLRLLFKCYCCGSVTGYLSPSNPTPCSSKRNPQFSSA